MYEIGVTAQFEAAHRLVGDFGPATRMHGHTYRLEVTVRGERLDGDGVLFDIGTLQPAVEALAASFHYRDLAGVPGLNGRNTTAETVADHCWEALAASLHGHGLTSLGVRIRESPGVWAGRENALQP